MKRDENAPEPLTQLTGMAPKTNKGSTLDGEKKNELLYLAGGGTLLRPQADDGSNRNAGGNH